LKIEPAILAVGDHVQSQALLELDGFPDRIIFDPMQILFGDFALIALRIGLFEMGRPQQAADHVGSYPGKIFRGYFRHDKAPVRVACFIPRQFLPRFYVLL
jgi:hypothetical protein